jgi:hypothetical protein
MGLGLAGLCRVVPEPGAVGEPFDVGGEDEREPLAAGPAVVLPLRERNEVVAVVLREKAQSTFAPEAFTTGASLAISAAVSFSVASGLSASASAPIFS